MVCSKDSCHHLCCKVYGFQKTALVKPLSNAQQRFQETSLRVETSTLGFLTHFCWNMVSRQNNILVQNSCKGRTTWSNPNIIKK